MLATCSRNTEGNRNFSPFQNLQYKTDHKEGKSRVRHHYAEKDLSGMTANYLDHISQTSKSAYGY